MKSKNLIWFVAGILLMLILVQGVQAAESYGYVTQWGTYGSGDGQFFNPYGICAGPLSTSYVYVVDLGNNRVQKFTTEGVFYSKHGSSGSGDGQFTSPTGCAVDNLGNNYIVDAGNSRVQRFGAAGNYYNQWGSAGSGDGQFLNPRGIADQSPAHNNYVADSGNNRVQKFNINGDYLTKWGSLGSGDGQFNQPFGIAVDSAGTVYVADTGNNRIQKFNSIGTYVTQWGSSGSGNGEFDSPRGIALDSAGNVFVVDTGNNRIQKFTSTGTYVTQWGSFGTGNGEFNSPEAIAVDADGNVYVTDLGNNRIQKFELLPISIEAAGDQSYYFGEKIKLSGTNTDTSTTYLFIMGPSPPGDPWPSGGAQLNTDPKNSPVTDNVPATFTQAAVTGGTWSLDWQLDETMADSLDPGDYTIYAVTQPRDKNNLASIYYATVSILLKRPFITAHFHPVMNGPIGTVFTIKGTKAGSTDPVFITMTNNSAPFMLGSLPAEGVKPEDLSIVSTTGNGATFGSAPVNPDATFSYDWNTGTLAGGSLLPGTQYGFVVSNHPLNIDDQFASPLYSDYYTKLQVGIDGVHADYSVDKTSGIAPLTVAFTDISTCVPYVIESWSIDYGDGVTEGSIPGGGTSSHTYASAGTYNPEITACNADGCDTGSGETITVTSASTTGSIVVTSDPSGAAIYLDGSTISSGPTPATLTGISVGPHTVKVTLTNYFDVVQPVIVESELTTSVSVTMDEIPVVLTDKAKEAVQATMTDVLKGDTSGKVVYVFNTDTAITNPIIKQWPDLDDVTFTHPGVISYVDLLPEANDAKEGLFVNTYTEDGIIKTETKPSYSPATQINDQPGVFTHGAGIQPSPGELGIPNDPKVWAPGCTVNCDNYYALLISGGTDREHNEVRYWNDISYMYNVLIENGYKPGNIKVLVSDGANPYNDRHIANSGTMYDNSPLDLTYPADGYNDVNDAATKQKVLDYLRVWQRAGSTPAPTAPLVRSSLTAGKTLLIFTTSHGSKISGTTRDTNVVNLNLWNAEAISDTEFAAELAKIDAGSITVVMEQCNGGGLYDNWLKPSGVPYTGTQKRTLITAADWNEPSWGNGFSDAWTSGVAGHLRGAESTCCVGWDKAADNIGTANERVSLQESYKYVMPDTGTLRDPYATRTAGLVTGYEHPQIFSAGTSNDPAAQYLNDCTGTVASKIDTVTPATPSVWKQGSHQIISWKATALAGRMVKVTLFKGTSLYPVVSCSPGVDAEKTTSVGWYVPSGTGTGVPPTGTSYKIKVETCSGTAVSGTSVGTIQINPPAATPDGTITINTVPSTGIKLFWEGTQVATSTPYTRTDKDGKYSVRVTKDSATDNPKYYPYDALVPITAGQTNTLATWNLLAKPTGTNGEDLDPAPEGGVLVNADQDPALVWTCKYDTCDPKLSTCPHPTNCEHSPNVETPNIEKRLVAGFSYDVYVTKDGFLPSEKQTVYIEQPYPYRVLVPLYFTLTQKPEVPAKVLIVPNPLNIGKTGYFLAIVRLPDGYKAADVDAGSVYCEGAKALKLVRIKLFPRIFAGIFSRQDLDASTTGNIKMNVRGLIKKNGDYDPFRGSDTVTVINKKVTTKEDIDNVMTMTDTQIFTKFNKF